MGLVLAREDDTVPGPTLRPPAHMTYTLYFGEVEVVTQGQLNSIEEQNGAIPTG